MVVFIAKVLSFFMPTARLRKNARRKLVLAFWTHCAKRQVKVHGKGFVATSRCGLTKQTEIGDGVILGGVCVLGDGKVKFGNYVSTGPNVIIQTQSHEYEGEMLPYGVGYRVKDVEIGDAVWIGMNVLILPGTRIGEGAIIQAGSVVHGEIPPCAIAGGNPAKVFAWRDKAHYEKLKSQGAYFATNSRFINGGVGV